MAGDRKVVDAAAFAGAAADWIVATAAAVVGERGHCVLVLAGGGTPLPVYRLLGTEPRKSRLPWAHVSVYFGDERAVPLDHPDSNYCAVEAALLRWVQAGQVHPMRADRANGAAEYEALLPSHLDLLILGMGADGHTASLFPGSPALDEARRRVVEVRSPRPPSIRLTITPPVIAAARAVLVLAAGRDKARMVQRALEGPFQPREVPAQLARGGTWIIDREAASGLA